MRFNPGRAPLKAHLCAKTDCVHQAYLALRWGFAALPVMTNWDMYLAPTIANLVGHVGLSGQAFMLVVGVVEIVAGLVVALKPRFGAYLVAGCLTGIILNLLLVPGFYNVALRDFGLGLGAIALAKLSQRFAR